MFKAEIKISHSFEPYALAYKEIENEEKEIEHKAVPGAKHMFLARFNVFEIKSFLGIPYKSLKFSDSKYIYSKTYIRDEYNPDKAYEEINKELSEQYVQIIQELKEEIAESMMSYKTVKLNGKGEVGDLVNHFFSDKITFSVSSEDVIDLYQKKLEREKAQSK